tara:strand:+ start:5428 stop:6075 length:648 start_codon:yes stop_codon:yes gene_type:complete
MKVIGIAGQMQNGKDTIADYLAEEIGWDRYAFATGVKEVYCEAFGVNLAFIEEWKTKPETPPGFGMTVRQGLQFIGDGFRKIVPTIWVDRCFKELVAKGPTVLSDVRYMNEAKAISQRKNDFGLTILVWRPGFENDDPNGSEAQIQPYMQWCRDTGYEGWICNWEDSGDAEQDCPQDMGDIDVFLRNDGSISGLFKKIDKYIIPLIEQKDLVIPF